MINNVLNENVNASPMYKINLKELFEYMPKHNSFWHYKGSLTSPNCSEIMDWYVNKNYIRVNSKQLHVLQFLWITGTFNTESGQGNNRPVQELGERVIHTGDYDVSIAKDTNWRVIVECIIAGPLFLIILA
jgi:carbonic anhydrase